MRARAAMASSARSARRPAAPPLLRSVPASAHRRAARRASARARWCARPTRSQIPRRPRTLCRRRRQAAKDRTRRPAQPAPLPSSTRPFAGRGREHMQSYQLAVVTELLKAFSRPPSHRPSTSPGSAGHFLCPVPFGRLHTFAAYEVGNRTPFPVASSIDLRPIHRRLSDRVMRLGRLRPQSLPQCLMVWRDVAKRGWQNGVDPPDEAQGT